MRSKKFNWELELYKMQEGFNKQIAELEKKIVKLSKECDIINMRSVSPAKQDINEVVAKQVQQVLTKQTVTDLLKQTEDSYEGFELPLDALTGSIGG